jgi:hypothetical protein
VTSIALPRCCERSPDATALSPHHETPLQPESRVEDAPKSKIERTAENAPNRSARDKLITASKRDILDYLREMDATRDVDLWQEAAAKLCDVLLVYRRSRDRSRVRPRRSRSAMA